MIRTARRKVSNAAQASVTAVATNLATNVATNVTSLSASVASVFSLAGDATRLVRLPLELVYSAVVVGGFLALLLQDQVHPVMIYLIRMYLSV